MPEEKRNGTIAHYRVRVRNISSEEVFRYVNVSAENVSVEINKLEMYVTYRFQVQAFTTEGEGPFSEPVNGTTNQTGKATQ